jgi:hypothetical protein
MDAYSPTDPHWLLAEHDRNGGALDKAGSTDVPSAVADA